MREFQGVAGAVNALADAHQVAVALFEVLGSGDPAQIARVADELTGDLGANRMFRQIFADAERVLNQTTRNLIDQGSSTRFTGAEHDTTASGSY